MNRKRKKKKRNLSEDIISLYKYTEEIKTRADDPLKLQKNPPHSIVRTKNTFDFLLDKFGFHQRRKFLTSFLEEWVKKSSQKYAVSLMIELDRYFF